VRRGRDGGRGEQADGGSRRRRHGCPVPAAAGPAVRCCRWWRGDSDSESWRIGKAKGTRLYDGGRGRGATGGTH
jgi:hypothetical protein